MERDYLLGDRGENKVKGARHAKCCAVGKKRSSARRNRATGIRIHPQWSQSVIWITFKRAWQAEDLGVAPCIVHSSPQISSAVHRQCTVGLLPFAFYS